MKPPGIEGLYASFKTFCLFTQENHLRAALVCKSMKRRVYVAITLPTHLQEEILAFQKRYTLPVRWIAGKNLHITLVPPWYCENLDEVKEQLQRLAKHRPFDIALNTVTYGPSYSRPRVIWTTGPTTKDILSLQEHVESVLGAHHERQFRLHVTLARFNPERFRPTQKINEPVSWRFTVDSVVLMESHLSSQGSDYEILHEVKFQ
jgi:RNA 2',3'-cyclic 3'-phosphodiesterase